MYAVPLVRSRSNQHCYSWIIVNMQYLIVIFALFGCALGQYGSFRGSPSQNAYRPTAKPTYQPQANYQPQYNPSGKFIAIRSQQKDTYPDGRYTFGYETDNGISVYENGQPGAGGPEGPSEVVQGRFSYPSPDGTQITVEYTADENGFHPQGAHLPTPPPIPEAIRRALAANPPGPGDDSGDYRPQNYGGRPSFGSTPYRRY